MNRQIKRLVAPILAVTMLLSNSSSTVSAEEANNKAESVVEESSHSSEDVSENTSEDVSQGSDAADSDGEVSEKDTETSDTEISGEDTGASDEKKSEEDTEVSDDENTQINDTEEFSADEDINIVAEGEVLIQSAQDLVNLSQQVDASEYQKAKIILAPHDTTELNLSRTEFQGLGSDAYPFQGTISFSGDYTGYITLDKSLFNAVSGDARISELNLKTANNMTDPILAKNYVKGEQKNPTTISLKIDAKSTEITEGGGQTSYSSLQQ